VKPFQHRIEGRPGAVEIERLRRALDAWLSALEAPRDDVYAAISVVDEFASNLMEHSGATWMELCADLKNGRIHLSLRDDGKRFDSTEATRRDYTEYLKSDTDRKLGLYMVGKLTDDLKYEREEPDGVNCLTFLLKFKGWEAAE
jgi:anti-sigma regulatory factor (Ser/Thr protein kinase)